MNSPAWVKLELRNDSNQPLVVQRQAPGGFPLIQLQIRDAFGRSLSLGPRPAEDHSHVEHLTIPPGQAVSWQYDLVAHFDFVFGGKYTLHATDDPNSARLLDLEVSDLPVRLWSSRNAPFGYDPHRIYYSQIEIPAGSDVYARKEPIHPPPGTLYAEKPEIRTDENGNQLTYYAEREWSNAKRQFVCVQPLRLVALKHLQQFHELVHDADGHLLKWTMFKRAVRAESMEYDTGGRVVRHAHYDRHGDPNRATGVAWTAAGKIARREYFGPMLEPVRSFRYRYDEKNRRVKEERYDASGKLTDYFVLHPEDRRGNKVRYERFTGDGKQWGGGWLVPD